MMIRTVLVVGLAICFHVGALGQFSMDIPITKDAFIETNVGNPARADMNFGSHQLAPAHAWTTGGDFFLRRFIFDVDLSALPANVAITSAELYFFGNGNHEPLWHDNDATLEEVVGTWEETGGSGITWNTDSLTATGASVYLPPSDAGGGNIADLDYVVDVTSIVGANFSSGKTTTTFRLRLNTEQYYTRLIFCSSDHSTAANHPFIRLSYSLRRYAQFQESLDGGYYKVVHGDLKVRYEERYYQDGDDISIYIYNDQHDLVYSPQLTVQTGANLYSLDLEGTGLFSHGRYYTAEITDPKGRSKRLRFQYNE